VIRKTGTAIKRVKGKVKGSEVVIMGTKLVSRESFHSILAK